MEVLLILVMALMGLSNIACFVVGARVGQRVSNGEEVKLPNPVEAVREHKAQTEAETEKSKYETIMRNIDNYDGTEQGQEEVPWR